MRILFFSLWFYPVYDAIFLHLISSFCILFPFPYFFSYFSQAAIFFTPPPPATIIFHTIFTPVFVWQNRIRKAWKLKFTTMNNEYAILIIMLTFSCVELIILLLLLLLWLHLLYVGPAVHCTRHTAAGQGYIFYQKSYFFPFMKQTHLKWLFLRFFIVNHLNYYLNLTLNISMHF